MLRITVDTSGLEELARKLEAIEQTREVPIQELFSADFMSRHTAYASFDAMVAASGFSVATPADFAAIPDRKWDEHVRGNTDYVSWEAMQQAAAKEWAVRQLT